MNVTRSLTSLPYKECSIVPHARETQCAIFLTDETKQAQHKTEWRARHSGGSARWQAPHRRQKIPMITQPTPHIEAQPTLPDVQHRPHLHFPGQPHLRPAPQSIGATGTRPLNIALAGLQLLVGYEWLLAGGDKLLLGTFPTQLGGLLNTLVSSGHLVGFFTAILLGIVVPNATLFGYLIEWGETLAGLGLVTAGLVALLRPLAVRSLRGTSATLFVYGDRLLDRLAPLAATGTGLLGLSYFFLDGLPKPWFVPSIAFGGSIDTGLFFAAASVVLLVSQFAQRRPSR